MADIAEITLKDREKIKAYVDNSPFLTYTMSRAIIKCWFWAIEIVGSFLFIVSFLFLSFHYNFSFDRKVL